MKHFFKGEWIPVENTSSLIERLSTEVVKSLRVDLNINDVLDACDELSRRLKGDLELRNRLSAELDSIEIIDEVAAFCEKRFLLKKIEKELGGIEGFELRKQSFKEDVFESFAPLGTLVHITPSNSEGLSFLALIEGLLSLNANLVKISKRDTQFAALAAEALIECDLSGKIVHKIAILRISSSMKKELEAIMSFADGVSVWGGEGAISEIQKMTPQGARFIPWGHKISFAYIDKENLDNKVVKEKISSEIVSNEQQACSSPQVLYLETDSFEDCLSFSRSLFEVLKIESAKKTVVDIGIQEQAEITNQVELARLEKPLGLASVLEDEERTFRIIVEKNPGLRPSPLFRTLIVKPLPSDKIIEVLHPWRLYLQTVGLASSGEIGARLTKIFVSAGVNRITKIGEMLGSYEGEPHDGVYALTRFMRRVRAEISKTETIHRLGELEKPAQIKYSGKIMQKPDFQNLAERNIDKAELFFRSGGSSGKTALSLFSYKDYHVQMNNAAEGLFAAGLDPKTDRVMNLFFGGGLYGGFISFFTILEHLEAVQLPMAAHEDLKMVSEMIVSNKVDTLVGMPSYIIQLIKENKDTLKKYGKLKKIFYGGEHFSVEQKKWIAEEIGVELIRSAAYGSVDAGPLGFQCPACEGAVHHLLDSNQNLEILKLYSDEPCSIGETGRLVFSSKNREILEIKRYDLGDLGRWVEGDCPCSRKTPRFELQGRFGDIFRAGGTFINFQKIESILRNLINYSGESQVLISKMDGLDKVTLVLDSAFNQKEIPNIKEVIFNNYSEFNEVAVLEKGLLFEVSYIEAENFMRTSSSGKLRRVVDCREV